MMNVMSESIHVHTIRRATVLYTHDIIEMTSYIFNLNLIVYAHIFQGYLKKGIY
jgi:hypothetical protein